MTSIMINETKAKKLKAVSCLTTLIQGAYVTFARALVMRVLAKGQWMHCIIHREALAARQMSPELNDVINTVNFIKMRPPKARLFSALCEEMGAQHSAVLLHSDAWLLSQVILFLQVFERREEIQVFLEEERMEELVSDETGLSE